MSGTNYHRMVRAGSFLDLYLTSASDLETPQAYDFWSGLWCLSVAVGRRVWVDRPRLPVPLNLFLLIVDESGVRRKTTAVNRAIKQVRDADVAPNLFITGKMTPEALMYAMSDLANYKDNAVEVAVAARELNAILGRQSYVKDFPQLLLDLYDCDDYASPGTMARGKMFIKNTYTTLIGATTPSSFYKSLNRDIVDGGLMSRCIIVAGHERKKKVAWPSDGETQSDTAKRSDSLNKIKLRSQSVVYQKIGLQPAALRRFKSWYNARGEERESYLSSFQSREDEHVLRVAALLAVNDERWEITKTHIQHSIRLVEEAKEAGSDIFGTFSEGKTKLVKGIDKLRQTLIGAGLDGINQTELYRAVRTFMTNAEFRTLLEIMHELQLVQRFERPNNGRRGPIRKIWRATELIESPNIIGVILDEL